MNFTSTSPRRATDNPCRPMVPSAAAARRRSELPIPSGPASPSGPAGARHPGQGTAGNRLQPHGRRRAAGPEPAPDPLPHCAAEHRHPIGDEPDDDPPDGTADTALWHGRLVPLCAAPDVAQFRARPAASAVDLIVLHSISLPPGQYGGDEVQQLVHQHARLDCAPLLQDASDGTEVSAHFYVRRNGELWQFVSGDDRAWHAGNPATAGAATATTIPSASNWKELEGGPFEPAQYETLASLCAAIAAALSDSPCRRA